jgi:hypothetical protein
MARFKGGDDDAESNRLVDPSTTGDGAFGRAVWALYEDRSGNLWVGAEGEGAQQRSSDLVNSAFQMQRLAAYFPADRNRGLP